MKIITPVKITDAMYTGGNLSEADHAVYNAGTTYARGDYCIRTTTHTIYRSLEDASLGNDPDAEQVTLADPLVDDPSPINWQVMSSTNKWKVFDEKPSHICANAESIVVELTLGEFVQGIGLFGVNATSVQITMIDPVEGVVYDRTVDMYDNSVVIDWFTYYFEPFSRTSELTLTDLPPYAAAVISITLTRAGSTAEVGQIAVGQVVDIGFLQPDGSGFSGLDFSYVQNDEFGNLTTVKRVAARLSEYSVVVDTVKLLSIDRKLNLLRVIFPAACGVLWRDERVYTQES